MEGHDMRLLSDTMNSVGLKNLIYLNDPWDICYMFRNKALI